jgi:hypothetical protein
MHPVVKIYDQSSFERSDLNDEIKFGISIQNKGSYPAVLRPDFQGRRLNLYFDDVVEGPGAATPAEIEALFSFGVEWLAEVRRHPSSTVVHCGAGDKSKCLLDAIATCTLFRELYSSGHSPVSHRSTRRSERLDMPVNFREIRSGLRAGSFRGAR